MSEKDFNKIVNNDYHKIIIPLCRLLKAHATNALLLPNNVILMQSIIPGIRSYMISNRDIDYSRFLYSYISIPSLSKINTKFKKTKSSIDWKTSNGVNYLVVSNNDDTDPCEVPIINNPNSVANIIDATYNNIPGWKDEYPEVLIDESDSEYIKLPDSFIKDMTDKKLCDLNINDNPILISRPFLGDLKKTKYVGYRILEEDKDKIVLKFKQVEELGNIYTYSAFLKF